MKDGANDSRIHRLDWPTIVRALLWPVVIEGTFPLLPWLTSDTQGGAPHSPPRNTPAIIFLIIHLPATFLAMPLTIAMGLHYPYDGFVVIILQIILLSYLLFVRLRLKKIKIRL